jgi:hypothetical protein
MAAGFDAGGLSQNGYGGPALRFYSRFEGPLWILGSEPNVDAKPFFRTCPKRAFRKPYKFIGFGALDVAKPYEFIGPCRAAGSERE